MNVPTRDRVLFLGLMLLLLSASAALADSKTPRQSALETAREAVRAAMLEDEERAFEAYLETVHPDRKATDEARRNIRRYSWQRFQRQYDHFIKDEDVTTLEVQRMLPETVSAETETFRLFFEAVGREGRLPAPISFRRHGDRWLIDVNSL